MLHSVDSRKICVIHFGPFLLCNFFSIRFAEEMCVNYIHYYPKTTNLEVCKSSVDSQVLNEYFDYLSQ
jgi:hypothetical protein